MEVFCVSIPVWFQVILVLFIFEKKWFLRISWTGFNLSDVQNSLNSLRTSSILKIQRSYKTSTLEHEEEVTSANSVALLIITSPLSIRLHTARFTVPPIPSTGPLPWNVAKNDHSLDSRWKFIFRGLSILFFDNINW